MFRDQGNRFCKEHGLATIDLIEHISKNHEIQISNNDAVTLLNMRYYHGYKRYRYVKKYNASGKLNLSNFDEVIAIYNFDFALKSLITPIVISVETALKNRVIESLVEGKKISLMDVVEENLGCFNDYDIGSKKYYAAVKRYESVKQNMIETIRYYSDKSETVKYHLSKGGDIPFWVYFEIITLGQFSRFLSCMTREAREKLNHNFPIIPARSNSFELVVNSFIELRNASMHNSAIFDAHFPSGVSRVLRQYIKEDIKLPEFTCTFIEDYVILLIWILNVLNFPKSFLNSIINQFNGIIDTFDKEMNNREIFFKIISTNRKRSIQKLVNHIDK